MGQLEKLKAKRENMKPTKSAGKQVVTTASAVRRQAREIMWTVASAGNKWKSAGKLVSGVKRRKTCNARDIK